MKNLSPETLAAQAGGLIDAQTGAIVAPLHVATTYLRDPDNQYRKGYSYGRPDNATVRQVEDVMTGLEGAAASLVVASGMTAATLAMLALPRPAHIIAPEVMYWGLRKWLKEDAGQYAIETSFVDTTDAAAIRASLRPNMTKLIWLETPANPLWGIADIGEVAILARRTGALLGVDSTAEYPTQEFSLPPGASLLLYTDGVLDVEGAQSKRFGRDGLLASVNSPSDDSQSLVDVLLAGVDRFRGGRELPDDLTFVAIHLKAVAADGIVMSAARDERDVVTGSGHACAEIASDRACCQHRHPHVALRDRLTIG